MPREVKCFGCKTIVDDDSLQPKEGRTPCPQCGGLDRLVPIEATSRIRWRTEANDDGPSRSGGVHVAGDGVVTVTGSKTEALTFIEFPLLANATFELRVNTTDDDKIFIEVSKEGAVLGVGMGSDLVDAFLGMIPCMLPPDHPEYPRFPDR